MRKNEYQLPDAFQHMLDKGSAFDFTMIDNYMDCGIVETMLIANKKILMGDQLSYISESSTVVNSNIKYCSISNGCSIENSDLNNVIVLENTIVKNRKISRSF